MAFFLTGHELTMLTVIWWTVDPWANGYDNQANRIAVSILINKGLVKQTFLDSKQIQYELTDKGFCLMGAIHALPEPVNEWRIPDNT